MRPVSALLSLLVFSSLPALAEPAADDTPATSVQRILQRMDQDNDGKVSFEEYRNAMVRRFHVVDKNTDGTLQADEIPKEWVVVPAADLSDAQVTLEEFSAELRPGFARFDANSDGLMDESELSAFATARAAKLEAAP